MGPCILLFHKSSDKPSAGRAKGTELTQSPYLTVMHSDNYRSRYRETQEDVVGGEPPVVEEMGVFRKEGALLFVGSLQHPVVTRGPFINSKSCTIFGQKWLMFVYIRAAWPRE